MELQLSDGPVQPRPHNDNHAAEIGAKLADDLLMGLRFYSILPTGNDPHHPPRLSRIALALPFTSLVIGFLPALLLLILEVLGVPHVFAAGLAVTALALATGAMTEDALADSADGLFGGRTVEQRLEIMKDSRHGTYGVVAICLLLGLRIAAIGSVANPLAAIGIWLAATVIARSGALWLTMELPAARSGGSAAAVGRVSTQSFAIGAVFAVLLSFILAGFVVGIAGLALAYVLAIAVAYGWALLCRRLIGGQTGDLIGALQALLEIAVLSAFMFFV